MMRLEEKPAFCYCPKCGSTSFLSKDNGRSFNCDACRFQFFINNSAAVACLIFNSHGELLLTRRAFDPNRGMLDLPGGFVDPLETVEEAVIREIKEELNLLVTSMYYLISFPNLYPYSNIVVPTVDLAFVCTVDHFNELKSGDDVDSIEFIQPEMIDFNELSFKSMKQIILFYLKNKKF